jgi:general secretion pathway protein D
MLKKIKCLCAILAWASGCALAADGVTLNFTNADIDTVIKAVGEYTGRTFVIDPRVKGTINIVSAKPVPRAAIYPALLSSLRMAGYAAVESGGITKILPEIEAKTHGVAVGVGGAATVLTTRVIALQHESAAQLVNIIKPLVAPNNVVSAYAPANTLIITDYADNLRRIEQLIQTLDQPPKSATGEPSVVLLKHASASDVAQLLRNVFTDPPAPPGADTRERVLVSADSRLNAIVVRSDNPARLARALALARDLDQAPRANAGATGNVHIIRLRNANATDLALTLRKVLGAEGSAASSPAPSATPNLSSLLSNASAGGSTVPTAQLGNAPPASSNASPPSQVSFSAGNATIFADAANNTLIINAPELIARNLKAVVEQLDVRRAQVYIEALVVELTAEKAAEFGVQWQALSGLNNGNFRFVGGTNVANPNAIGTTASNALGLVGSISQSQTQSRGLALGALREINIPGVGTVYSLAALAKALEKDAKGNVLSMPTLLTLDNEEAKFSAGQNLPFVTGQYAVTGSQTTPTPFQTIERRDVGLTLKVKPQITEGGTIRLAVYQEVSNVVDLASSGAGPITNKRAVDTQVLVEDGQVIALGGLLQDALSDGEDRVPVLGSVPVLGNLFKFDARKRTKTSLMLFLRPTILRTAAQSSAFSQDRYEQLLRDPLGRPPEPTWFWPDDTAPTPSFPSNTPAPAAK